MNSLEICSKKTEINLSLLFTRERKDRCFCWAVSATFEFNIHVCDIIVFSAGTWVRAWANLC
jgi:hypothetical protein